MLDSLNVFVYGTLKPQEVNYLAYCEGKVITAIQAYTWGQIYHLQQLDYPAMTRGSNKVQGYLLTFKNTSVLENLDQLEGYQEQRSPEQNEYNRYIIDVYDLLTDQSLGQAWAYFMDFDKIEYYGGTWIPSGIWTAKQLYSKQRDS